MRHLIIMRHAKTEPWHEGIDDAGRALIDRGKRDAATVSRALVGAGITPDRVLVSTARRARETWASMSASFPAAQVSLHDELYLADPDEVTEAFMRAAADGETLLVIGHNPGLHHLVSELVQMGRSERADWVRFLIDQFPTGTAAVFDMGESGHYAPGEAVLKGVFWGREIAESAAD